MTKAAGNVKEFVRPPHARGCATVERKTNLLQGVVSQSSTKAVAIFQVYQLPLPLCQYCSRVLGNINSGEKRVREVLTQKENVIG